jgi:hypothetical protein|tara:strand:- start:2117 stop:2626 length:510 start_codon:yes stop_codon:yes gene_type:complete
MELADLEPRLEAPIPGMSMTHEVGARPWQQPAQYTNVEDVIDYYITRMSDDSFKTQLVNVIDSGVPLTSLANSIQLASVMQGIHSIDTGLLIMPVLMELMMLIAEQNDVEYITGMERNKKEEIKESVMQNALAKFQKEQDNETDDEVLDKVEVMPQEESMSGLMARRVK